MLVIRQMKLAGHRPLIGPYLSVNQVFTPPTYFYIQPFYVPTSDPLNKSGVIILSIYSFFFHKGVIYTLPRNTGRMKLS